MVIIVTFVVYLILIFHLCFCNKSVDEFYSSSADMKLLIKTHTKTLEALDAYLDIESKKLDRIEKFILQCERTQIEALENLSSYVENPLNAFKLIKGLTSDLDELDKIIKIKTTISIDFGGIFPTKKDFSGVVDAMVRLIQLYNLNPEHLADGMLITNANAQRRRHTENFIPMTAGDCRLLGTIYQKLGENKITEKWRMKYKEKQITERKYYVDNYTVHFSSVNIDTKNSSKTKQAMTRDTLPTTDLHKPQRSLSIENDSFKKQVDIYAALCNNKMALSQQIVKRLHCRYLTESHPFLILAPFKIEQIYINPDIIRIHQAISDQEIDHMLEISIPKLARSRVWSRSNGNISSADGRISKVAVIDTPETAVTRRLQARTETFTGMSMTCNTYMQLQNYGVGGYFGIHHDYTNDIPGQSKNISFNIIATAMYYLTDDIQGGATVFTKLGVALFPVRGTALYWRNLHASGAGDPATAHSGCPVVSGEKWIINKFIYQGCQMFTHPCNLEYQKQQILHKIIPPVQFNDV